MTKLQFLNVYLTERLMLAAQEIYKTVEDTILEYQEEIIRGKRENDQLRRKLHEAGIETWPDRQSFAPVESEEEEEEEEDTTGLKVESEPKQTVVGTQECKTTKVWEKNFRGLESNSTFTPHGNGDYSQTLPQPTSHHFQAQNEEAREEDSLASSTSKQIKIETGGLGVCSSDSTNHPETFCASAQSENSVSMMGVEGDGLLSGFEALQLPHPDHALQVHDTALCCTVCGKSCRHTGHLNAHARTHTKERPFLCVLCGKSFGSSARLKGHQRIHTGEKPYQCHICRKRFNQTAHLKVHLRVHTGEKPFSCPVCGKSFSQSNKVKRHLVTHSRDRMYLPGQ